MAKSDEDDQEDDGCSNRPNQATRQTGKEPRRNKWTDAALALYESQWSTPPLNILEFTLCVWLGSLAA